MWHRKPPGICGLIAKQGLGKTTLLYELLRRLRTSGRTAFLSQSQIGPRDFLRSFLAELEVDAPGQEFFHMHRQLNEILIQEANSNRRLILVIDEAQDLEEPVLEMVRTLSNFETARAKLMEIVIAGQPALAEKLAQPALVQVRQRISIVGRLKPLSDTETTEYIDHRLRVAGCSAGHKKDVYAVAFSPDSRWLASASGDKSVKLWDVVAGREVHTLEGHRNSVTSLAFSPDGRWLASGSWDKTIKIWDVETGREVQTLVGHTHRLYTVAVDSRGRWLASGSEDGTIKLRRLRRPVDHSALR